VALGFLGGRTGRSIREALDAMGIAHAFTEIEGETRTNLKLDDPLAGTHTDVNEAGPAVGAADRARLESALFHSVLPGDIFVFSGSAPAGLPAGIYATWIERARALGALSVLDAEGDLLRLGQVGTRRQAKPNREELERLVGRRLATAPDLAAAARSLVAGGCGRVVVSLGAEGALFADAGGAWLAEGLSVEALSTVGAGDTMVAALALGLERGEGLESMIAPAVGAATAAVLVAGSGACDPAVAARFAAKARWAAVTPRV
jgi:1-phosphofructokinase